MQFVQTVDDGAVRSINLVRAKANALNRQLVGELREAIRDAERASTVGAIVLGSGLPRFFSSGFDAHEVFSYDSAGMGDFFGLFIDLYEAIFHLSKPVVAALSGHTVAGGAVLALACDFRVMAEGDAGFALNEINLGVILPPAVIRMANAVAGPRYARRLLLCGHTFQGPEALEAGLADQIAPPHDVPARATDLAQLLGGKPAAAFAAVKRMLHESNGLPPGASDSAHLPEFVGHWFSPESVERRRNLVESLRR